MVVAFSYAVGPAILAALQPDAGPHVGTLLAVGGYYDIEAVVTFFTTGNYRQTPDMPWRHRTPNVYGKWAFARSNAASLNASEDRAAMAAIANRKLGDPDAAIGDLVARLGPEGRAVLSLLVNQDPERVPALIAGLPAAIRQDMTALDIRPRDMTQLRSRLLLIHGRDDAIIPHTESVALAAAVSPDRVSLHIVNHLAHMGLGRAGPVDSLVLWRAAYEFLKERDFLASGAT